MINYLHVVLSIFHARKLSQCKAIMPPFFFPPPGWVFCVLLHRDGTTSLCKSLHKFKKESKRQLTACCFKMSSCLSCFIVLLGMYDAKSNNILLKRVYLVHNLRKQDWLRICKNSVSYCLKRFLLRLHVDKPLHCMKQFPCVFWDFHHHIW